MTARLDSNRHLADIIRRSLDEPRAAPQGAGLIRALSSRERFGAALPTVWLSGLVSNSADSLTAGKVQVWAGGWPLSEQS